MHSSIRTIDNRGDADDSSVVGFYDADGFLDAAPLGDDIFNNKDFFFRINFESASQHEFAFLFFGEDESHSQLSRDFLADHQSAHGGSDDGYGAVIADFVSESAPEFFDGGHLLESEGALEVLAAVQTTSQYEMALEQCTALAKDLQYFIIRHAADDRGRVGERKRNYC